MPTFPRAGGPFLEQILDDIVWESTNESLRPFAHWSTREKRALERAYLRIVDGDTLGLPEVPPMDRVTPATEPSWTYMAPDVARQYFVGFVAQSLAVEMQLAQEGEIAWSTFNFKREHRALLFDSRSLFKWYSGVGAYVIEPSYTLGSASPGDPVRIFRFLTTHGLVGPTQLVTIFRLLGWCRQNLVHFSGQRTVENATDHWQYPGVPPVERVIAGTVRASTQAEMGIRHWTMGCTGTTGFLRMILRTINIPVSLEKRCMHALPNFVTVRGYLSHGDDPYGTLAEATPPIPINRLLIDHEKFETWFGATVPEGTICSNVGRRPLELAIEFLPNYLLQYHCDDKVNNLAPQNSSVLQVFAGAYTLAELQAAQLWQRMDAKILALGGCANVPAVTYGT